MVSRTISMSAARPPWPSSAGATAALRLLAIHPAGVTQPERTVRLSEGGRRHPCDARGEVEAEGENPAVAVGEAHQALRHPRAAGPEESVLVLEGRRKELVVPGALQQVHE